MSDDDDFRDPAYFDTDAFGNSFANDIFVKYTNKHDETGGDLALTTGVPDDVVGVQPDTRGEIGLVQHQPVPRAPLSDEDLASLSESARKYFQVLGDIENDFATYLRDLYGVPKPGLDGDWIMPTLQAQGILVSANGASTLALGTPGGPWAQTMAARYRETGKLLIQPEDDASISPMIVNADAFVGLLQDSVKNMNTLGDGKSESAEAKLVKGTDDASIKAACTLLFTALIHRCVIGIRGTTKRNESHYGDKQLTCQERFVHVARALKEEKTIARDILLEDGKIMTLVNAPITALKTKQGQRETNNKRADDTKKLLALADQQGALASGSQAVAATGGDQGPAPAARNKRKRKSAPAAGSGQAIDAGASGVQSGKKRKKKLASFTLSDADD